MPVRLRFALLAALLACGATLALASDEGLELDPIGKTGEFHFARMIYTDSPQYRGFGRGWWQQDWPRAEEHLLVTVQRYTRVNVGEPVTIWLNDESLFDYPWLYATQVGYWDLNDEEVARLREYLLRGGFLLVDDFRGSSDMQTFQYYLKRALPEAEFEMKPLDVSHAIFNCFFSIKSLEVRSPYGRLRPEFLGISDKHGRLMMIVNYNNDVSDYWQWSNDPFQPIEDTNTAYRFGVNYVFYALTH